MYIFNDLIIKQTKYIVTQRGNIPISININDILISTAPSSIILYCYVIFN